MSTDALLGEAGERIKSGIGIELTPVEKKIKRTSSKRLDPVQSSSFDCEIKSEEEEEQEEDGELVILTPIIIANLVTPTNLRRVWGKK